MRTDRTFTMIKPDAVQDGYIGDILQQIITSGFRIIALKYTQLSHTEVEAFYAIHRERPFFGELVNFMTSSPIVAAVLEKSDAVAAFRTLIGSTDPKAAAEETIRKKFARSLGENAIHGSDSNANAAIEIAFHFSEREIYS